MSTLRLFVDCLPFDPTRAISWCLLPPRSGGTSPSGKGDFSSEDRALSNPQPCASGHNLLNDLPPARRIEVFLSPAVIVRTRLTLPPKAGKQARALLTHALDPILLEDPQSQHIAYRLSPDGQCTVVVIARAGLADLLTTLREAKRAPQAVYTVDMLLPNPDAVEVGTAVGASTRAAASAATPGAAQGNAGTQDRSPPPASSDLSQEHHLCWLASGWVGYWGASPNEAAPLWIDSSSPKECPPLLALLAQTQGGRGAMSPNVTAASATSPTSPVAAPPAPHWVLTLPAAARDQVDPAQWAATLGGVQIWQAGEPLALPLAADAINLLQGDFTQGMAFDFDWERLGGTLKLLAALAVVMMLLWLGQWWSWRLEEKHLLAGIDTAFAQAFPHQTIVDARQQLQTQLRNRTTEASNASLVVDAALGKLLGAAPRLGELGLGQIQTLSYTPHAIEVAYRVSQAQLARLAQEETRIKQTLAGIGSVRLQPRPPDHLMLAITLGN